MVYIYPSVVLISSRRERREDQCSCNQLCKEQEKSTESDGMVYVVVLDACLSCTVLLLQAHTLIGPYSDIVRHAASINTLTHAHSWQKVPTLSRFDRNSQFESKHWRGGNDQPNRDRDNNPLSRCIHH